jgi:O-antigen/teichoic acid export membrane protein
MIGAVLALLGSQAAVTVLGVISGAVVNHTLGPVARGDYAEILSWIAIYATASGFSAATAIYHYSNRRLYEFSRGELFGTVTALGALGAALAALGLTATVAAAPFFVSQGLVERAPLAFLAIASSIGFMIVTTLLKVAKGFSFLSLTLVAMQLAMTSAITALAVAGSLSVTALLAVNASVQLVAIAAICSFLHRSPGWRPVRLRASLLARLIGSGLRAHIATVATLLYVRFDQILVYHLASAAETGLYAAAVGIVMQLMVLPMTIQEVLYPRVIEAESGGDADVTMRVAQIALLAFGGCVIVTALLAKPLVTLYAGREFSAAVPLLQILLPGAYFFAVPNLLSPYWAKRGYFLLGSVTALLLLAVNLGLNWLWIPDYGGNGAAWATTVTYFVGMCMSLALFRYLSGRNPLAVFRIHGEDAAVAWRSLRNLVRERTSLAGTTGR